jgi:DNA polymerase elongation subunit (family B)
MDYKHAVKSLLSGNRRPVIAAFDVESLMSRGTVFLSGERIIAISYSVLTDKIHTNVYVSDDDSESSEYNLLSALDSKLKETDPEIIIGYNHTGYDIPLIQMKIKKLSYENRLRSIERSFGTAYCLDMMYVIADDLGNYDGDYHIRKLDNVVTHERYINLPLQRAKYLTHIDGKTKGEAIKDLWMNDRKSFIRYCTGDSSDLIYIFMDIFGLKFPEL